MALVAGTRLGAYEIVGPLGSGGMGEVYRARDRKLGRQVALKLLSDEAACDPDRLARFDREAQTLAGLDHPSIVHIYSVEEAASTHFITMSLVEGRTLAEVMPAGGFPLERLLAIAAQVADAVAAAHQHGIVHRDLKPANIMVGAHDRVTVLDFGLAKLRQAAPVADVTLPPTCEVTGEGRIVGTIAYMSPEQAEGRSVDERSDVFSLGIVLYEMATGERPFSGETSLSVLSAILKDSPKSIADLKPELPRDLARIVRRCLSKAPDRRYQSAVDLRNDLEDLKHSVLTGEVHAVAALPPPSKTRAWPVLAAAATIVALAAIGWSVLRATPATDAAPPSMTFSRLTMLEGVVSDPVLSPDGKWVVYASPVSGNQEIYLQSTAGQTAINLTKHPSADVNPAFSPDGESIAFQSNRDGGGLFVMGRTGESVRRLTANGFTPAWFPDGRQIVYATQMAPNVESRGGGVSELWAVDARGGEPRRLFAGDALQPRVSPQGRRIAFWSIQVDLSTKQYSSANRDLWTIAPDGTDPVRLTDDESTEWNPVWSTDGRWLYFLSNRSGSMNLWRIPVDEASGKATGIAQPMTTPASYIRYFTLSADGRMGTFATLSVTSNLARVQFDARTGTVHGAVQRITTGPRDFSQLEVSPDGKEIVVGPAPRQQEDLILLAPDSGSVVHLTGDAFRDRNAHFMPDGRRIVFNSDRGASYDLWSIDRDGSGLRQLTTTTGRYFPVPSPDGSRILAADINNFQLFVYAAGDFSKPPELLPPLPPELRGGNFTPRHWSRDGKKLLGVSAPVNWVYEFDTKQYRALASFVGSNSMQWFDDNRRLLITREGGVFVGDSVTGDARKVLSVPGEAISAAQFSSNGWLYFLSGNASGDIWVVRFGESK